MLTAVQSPFCLSRIPMSPVSPQTLAQIPLLNGLTPEQCDYLAARLHLRNFPGGVDIITAGAEGQVIYILLQGTVKVYVPELNGNEVIVNILGPGDTVGEMSLVDRISRSASVITMEPTTTLWMGQADFQAALETIPVLSQNLLRILSRRVRSSTAHIRALAALDVHGRVARQLLTFAERYGQVNADGSATIRVRLTQGEISELVGASRKRVNQVMVAFRKAGWVTSDANYHITLLNQPALIRVSETAAIESYE
ncbi:MAG TPA: Crp/Fnr family transcriptional regulator [Anaerolineaceae bacterium]|nr:Crp/Fnr family transcriptional regulator [Anaerolineaceae bacterium]HOD05288.1 Crp/Fnr family transcriptional regulator [Anaerolineaceae bacterium]HOG78762.1 Crp/Fnr family transcriptional regulator [Anaerolineaceae bacterium]HQN42718.1 Crp/Fnr family transcriptional regulator [Anaerolineaceae bacterium]